MSPTIEPGVELVLAAKSAELPGGLHVRRALPQARRRMVGPFVFIDQMGPATLGAGQETKVLAHPHIGLSTLTYLFEGEGLHKDSLGRVQKILPGEVNWMTAGKGVVHAEFMRAPAQPHRLFGVQLWVALPKELEECEPSFDHYDTSAVPLLEDGGVTTRLIAGSLWGARSQVKTSSPLFYCESILEAGAVLELPPEYEERSAFIVEGSVEIGAMTLGSGELAFFEKGATMLLRAREATRLLLLGGEPLEGPRHIAWNFVSSSRDRVSQAIEDWRNHRFPRVPGEDQFIPWPADGDAPVFYP